MAPEELGVADGAGAIASAAVQEHDGCTVARGGAQPDSSSPSVVVKETSS